MKTVSRCMAVAALTAILYGCGGGSGGSGGSAGPMADNQTFAAGKATVVFTAMSTAHLAAPISGIDFTVTLPAGMSVTTKAGSSEIETASLTPGAVLAGTNLAIGTYSASTGEAHLSMVTTSETFRSGEFLRLSCNVASGTNITLANVKALNTQPRWNVYGSMNTTMVMTDNVRITMGAVQ